MAMSAASSFRLLQNMLAEGILHPLYGDNHAPGSEDAVVGPVEQWLPDYSSDEALRKIFVRNVDVILDALQSGAGAAMEETVSSMHKSQKPNSFTPKPSLFCIRNAEHQRTPEPIELLTPSSVNTDTPSGLERFLWSLPSAMDVQLLTPSSMQTDVAFDDAVTSLAMSLDSAFRSHALEDSTVCSAASFHRVGRGHEQPLGMDSLTSSTASVSCRNSNPFSWLSSCYYHVAHSKLSFVQV
mmetsp:Transcript_37084/g.57483  ORF Transcript_37084/g.57483 Transcript_37084/m.57483 type:complete len:240 (+) Transcript_37084:35-754(+)